MQQLDDIAKILGEDLTRDADKAAEIAAAVKDASENARRSALQTFGARTLQIEIDQNSGKYKDNPKQYTADLSAATAQLKANNALTASFEKLTQAQQGDAIDSLTKLMGVQGEYITQSEIEGKTNAEVATIYITKLNEINRPTQS